MSQSLRVLPALDGVRAIAVLMVLARHCFYLEPTNQYTLVVREVVGMMWLGVDLFFVLSGFLITRILRESRGQSRAMLGFYWRRAVRILPAYAVCVLLGVFLMVHPEPLFGGDSWRNLDWLASSLPRLATFTINLPLPGWSENYGSIGHLWSLAVEEQFYLVWPWIVLAASMAIASLRRVCAWLILLSVVAKMTLALCEVDPWLIYSFTLCRMDALACGALVALMSDGRGQMPSARVLAASSLAGLLGIVVLYAAIYLQTDYWLNIFAPMCLSAALCFSSLIALIASGQLNQTLHRLLSSPLLRWIGHRSYGIYLLHLPLKEIIDDLFAERFDAAAMKGTVLERFSHGNGLEILTGTITVTATFLAAAAMYRWLEKPLLDWNRHRQTNAGLSISAHAPVGDKAP